jgi:hypothetical protein
MTSFEAPIEAGFVLHAWAVENRPLFDPMLEQYAARLRETSSCTGARAFRLQRKPPGRPPGDLVEVLRESPRWSVAEVSPRFDAVLLAQFANIDAARVHLESADTARVIDELASHATTSHVGVYRNIVRVGTVDEGAGPSYLFNFFYTDRPDTFLDTWKRTSHWFFRHTGLTSSFVLCDVDPDSRFPFVNHAHWHSLWRLVLSVVFRPSFRTQVLKPFIAARMLPNAILYRET